MDEIVKRLLLPGSLTGILFLLLWTMFSKRLKADIEHENAEKLAEHTAKVEHLYSEKLVTHTATLTRDNELEIAEFKHQLEKAATEQHFASHMFLIKLPMLSSRPIKTLST